MMGADLNMLKNPCIHCLIIIIPIELNWFLGIPQRGVSTRGIRGVLGQVDDVALCAELGSKLNS